MATEVVKIVDTGGTGDYSDLAAWEAGEQRDLVTADEIAIADCRCTTGAADTTAMTIDGWTTDDTRYIKIWTDPDQGYRHSGKPCTSCYRLEHNTSAHTIRNNEPYTRIEGIAFSGMGSSYSAAIYAYATTFICKCFIYGFSSSGHNRGIYCDHWGAASKVWNNIVIDPVQEGFYGHNRNHYFYNNTAINCGYGFRGDGDIVINCLAQDCTDGFYGTFDSASDYNCSDISGDAPGSNSVTGTVTFVDAANDDYHLDSSDTVAKDAGTNLSSDPYLSFTDDIDGETRSAPWDIGADEYVSGGGGQTALFETSLNLAASQQAVGHYSASLTSSVGLTGAQTSLAHLLAALSGNTSLSEQLQALAHLQGQLSSTAHLESQSSGLRHRQGQFTSTTNFQDQLAGLAHLQATLSASLDVSSPITMTASLKGQLSSSLTITGSFEVIGAATALFTSIITLNESLETKASLLATISDTLTLSTTPSALASLKAALTSTFGLSSEFSTQLIMALSAALELGASTEALGHFLASLSDSLIATDSAEVTVHYKLNLSDNLSLGEQITAAASYIMMLTDALGLSALVRDVTVTASGVVTITFNAENPGVSFSAGCPGATFSGKGPNESFS